MVCFEILGNIYWCSTVDEYVLGEKYISIAPNKCVLQFSVYFALKAPFVSSAKRGGDPCARLPSCTIILLRALQPDLHLLSLPISPPSPFQYPAAPLSPPLMASRERESAQEADTTNYCAIPTPPPAVAPPKPGGDDFVVCAMEFQWSFDPL
jgi:hypothetical protein